MNFPTTRNLLSISRNLLVAPAANEKLCAQREAYARRAKDGRSRMRGPFIGVSAGIQAADTTPGDLTRLRDKFSLLDAKVEARLAALLVEKIKTTTDTVVDATTAEFAVSPLSRADGGIAQITSQPHSLIAL